MASEQVTAHEFVDGAWVVRMPSGFFPKSHEYPQGGFTLNFIGEESVAISSNSGEVVKDTGIEYSPFIGGILNEGKTKIIHETNDPSLVWMKNKDDITTGDGVRRYIIPGKGEIATTTTVNCFQLLNKMGMPTHFVGQDSPESFVARRVSMIPLEVVSRREIAPGSSYLKRHPEAQAGDTFNELPVEFYFKDDANHDPLVTFQGNHAHFFDAKKPQTEGFLGSQAIGWLNLTRDEVQHMRKLTREAFTHLEQAFQQQGVAMIDLKIEFGRLPDGTIVIADVIDNDAWRLWPQLDKQYLRDLVNPTPEDLLTLRNNYQQVADLTGQFLKVR